MELTRMFSDIDLNEIAESIWSKKGKKATLWDVLVEVLAKKADTEPFVIWMMSDFAVIELVARGHGVDYIMDVLDISKKEVISTCKTWGMVCFKETLDFDPVLVYNRGMSMATYKEKLRPILYYMPDDEDLENTITNVSKYRSVKKLLDKWRE